MINKQSAGLRVQGSGLRISEIGNRETKPQVTKVLLILTLMAVFAVLCPEAKGQQGAVPSKKPVIIPQTSIEKRIGDLEKDTLRLDRQMNLYNLDALPDFLTLCDKKVPIFKEDVRERFEREFFLILENKGLLTTVVKRYFKFLPLISEEIQKQSLPTDLIFLAVAESYLNPRSVSSASAAGMWQFIKETGKKEGLTITDDIDERYAVKKSTQSALSHLKRLYGEFNDWFIAMAAYNAGVARLREVIENQNTRDFFDMLLPEETERYVFRIVVLKEVILNRERYGITIEDREMYRPLMLAEVVMETDKEIQSSVLAQAMEVSYRTFRINNLQIRKYKMPRGSYRISVPVEKKNLFIRNMKNYDYVRVY